MGSAGKYNMIVELHSNNVNINVITVFIMNMKHLSRYRFKIYPILNFWIGNEFT